ncbi:hypothetical protein [Actinoalloteichus hymeniacidonis]|uniref:Uncharacterized protein n=1 Tax=Actinoalloteichus hymeniacidonis TaxID=340345 RepID=A0AAC9N0H7_9PSEU|nr:hypothetical protein [Actinoalloteichus hymeniacidonis]AOS65087.1 hypothetical protein TL08_21500 [Actinoalloteichus hymeniacidonis]MBB5906834.1 hypothetical protein [Actinoalloteichus hymeniacidonis]
MLLALQMEMQNDPTGLSSPLGRLIMIAGLAATVLVAVSVWWRQRKR